MVGFLCAVAEKGDLASTALSELFPRTTQIPKSLQVARPQLADSEENSGDAVGWRVVCAARSMQMLELPRLTVQDCSFLCGKGPVFWSPSLLRQLPLHPD